MRPRRNGPVRPLSPPRFALCSLVVFAAMARPDPAAASEVWASFTADDTCGAVPRPDCPFRLYFSDDMVRMPDRGELEGMGPVTITMRPPIAGRYAWQGAQTLVFTPAEGVLDWGHAVDVTLTRAIPLSGPDHRLTEERKWTVHRRFSAAGKVADWPVHAGQPRFVAFLDDGSRLVGQGPVHALYDQPVDPKRFGRLITAMDDRGEPVTARVTRPRDLTAIWPDGGVDPRHVLAIQLRGVKPTTEGRRNVVVSLPTWSARSPDDEDDQARGGQRFTQEHFTVVAEFESARLEEHEGSWGPHNSPTYIIGFDRPVRSSLLEAHLELSPRPDGVWADIDPWELKDAERDDHPFRYGFTVRFDGLEPGTDYRVRLRKGLPDLLGNRLAKSANARFRTDDLDPYLRFEPERFAQEEGRGAVTLSLLNARDVTVTAHALDAPGGTISAVGLGRPVPLPAAVGSTPMNTPLTITLPLPAELTGPHRIVVFAKGRGNRAESEDDAEMRAEVDVQLTDLAATAKVGRSEAHVWVTRLSTGEPVPHAELDPHRGASAFADASGVARLPASAIRDSAVTIRHGDDLLVLRLDETNLASPWQFGHAAAKGPPPFRASVFTERGAYRPGETVHGHVLVPCAGRSGAPHCAGAAETAVSKVHVVVVDAVGEVVVDERVELDAFGVAAFQVELEDGAALGRYSVRAQPTNGGATVTHPFVVEAYRVPTFAVTATATGAKWAPGRRVKTTVEARYLHGGRLSGRPAQFVVERTPVPMRSAQFPGYVFGAHPDATDETVRVADGELQLDERGQAEVGFAVAADDSQRPRRYTVWTEVADLDRQRRSATLSQVVHARSVYVGTRVPEQAIVPTGTPLDIPVVAIDASGNARPGVRAEVIVERLENGRARRLRADGEIRWLNTTTRRRVDGCRVRTAAVPRRCTVQVTRPGRYRVRVAARGGGAGASATVYTFSAAATDPGDSEAAWPRFSQDRIAVVADRQRYAPGDVARLLIESPFDSAWAWVTLERAGVRWHQVFAVTGDAPTVDIPLNAGAAPSVHASVVLVRGRTHHRTDGAGIETGRPVFKMGYVELEVDPAHRRLTTEVKPATPTVEPGGEATVAVVVAGPDGQPVNGQAIVMVVDEAVLGLTRYRTPDPIGALLAPDPLQVQTAETRLDLPDARIRRGVLSPSAGGDDPEAPFEPGPPPELTGHARSLFRTTAFVDARVALKDGQARVTFTLPDNTTTYRVMAVAVDDAGRVGSADAGITVKTDLMVSPIAPRFVHAEDTLTLGALVYNDTAEAMPVQVTAAFDGLELVDPDAGRASGTVGPEGSATFDFPVRVHPPVLSDDALAPRDAAITLTLHGPDGAVADRVRVQIPILDAGTEWTIHHAATAEPRSALSFEANLPGERRPGSGRIAVRVSSQPLVRMAGGIEYLMEYPHGCIEQTTSGLHPLVVLDTLVEDAGVKIDEQQRRAFVEAGIERLTTFRTHSGGLGYWPGNDAPHPYGTAYALNALVDARAAGFAIPEPLLDGMADYLAAALRAGNLSSRGTEALAVLALQRLGRPHMDHIRRLAQRPDLDTFARALTVAALNAADADTRDPTLLRATLAGLVGAGAGGTGAGTPFGSSTRNRAAALMALAGTPRNALVDGGLDGLADRLLDALLDGQSGGAWSNTQDNAFAVVAIARHQVGLRRGQQAVSAEDIQLTVGGVDVGEVAADTLGTSTRRFTLTEARLGLLAGGGEQSGPLRAPLIVQSRSGKPLTVEVRTRYRTEVASPMNVPVTAGFTVNRTYTTLDGKPLGPDDVIPLGSIVRVRLDVRADARQEYVAIADRLPAGLEPMGVLSGSGPPGATRGPTDKRTKAGAKILSHHELRDDRAQFYVDDMPRGAVAFTYLARATTPGRFHRPAARVEAMYAPSVTGATAIDVVVVGDED